MPEIDGDGQFWPVRRFSQSNPEGGDQGDVAELLRRVAGTIDGLDDIEVQDIVFHLETSMNGESWPSITVYFHRGSEK